MNDSTKSPSTSSEIDEMTLPTSKNMGEMSVIEETIMSDITQGSKDTEKTYSQLPSKEKPYSPRKIIVRRYQLYKTEKF